MAEAIQIEVGDKLDLDTIQLDDEQETSQRLTNSLLREMDVAKENRRAARDLAAKFSLLHSSINQTSPLESYQEMTLRSEAGVSVKDQYNELRETYKTQLFQDLTQEIIDNPMTFEGDNRMEMVQSAMSVYDDPDAIERINFELFSPKSTEDFRNRQEMTKQYAFRGVQEALGERGVYDWTTDMVESVFPLGFSKDVAELTGKIWPGNSYEEFLTAAYEFQSLDPDEQMAVWDESLKPRVLEAADDNFIAAMTLAGMFFDPNVLNNMAIEIGFDWVGAGGYLAGGVKAARFAKSAYQGAKNIRNIPKQYKDMGNDEASSVGAAVASASEDATPMGMTKTDAAATADIHATEDVISNSIDGISDAMQKARKSAITRMLDDAAHTLSEGPEAAGRANLIKSLRKDKADLRKAERALEVLESVPQKAKNSLSARAVESTRIRAQVLRNSIEADELTLAGMKAVERANVNRQELLNGNIPDNLKETFEDLIQAELEKEHKLSNAAVSEEALAVKKQAEAYAGKESMAREMLNDSARGGRLLDNPELYGLSEGFAAMLTAAARPIRKSAEEVRELAPTAITPERQKEVINSVKDKLAVSAKNNNQEFSFGEVELTDNGFKAKYSIDGTDEVVDYNWTIDDVATSRSVKDLSKITNTFRNFLSPEITMKNFEEGIVPTVKFAQDQAAKSMNFLKKQFEGIERGLSKQQRGDLDALIIAGDESEQVFKFQDLRDGLVEIRGNKKPFDREVIQAYYMKRAFMDELHSLSNSMYRRQLDFLGMRNVNYIDEAGDNASLIGRPVNANQVQTDPGEFIFNGYSAIDGKSRFLNPDTARAFAKDHGYEFVRLLEPISFGKKETRFAIIKTDDMNKTGISALPDQVLNYKPGYVPRIYRPGYWYVKSSKDGSTLFAAETSAQASRWAAKATEEASDGTVYTVKSDRQNTPVESIVLGTESFGGLYTGTRKQKPLMVKVGENEFKRPERLSSNDAIERYVRTVSNNLSMSEYRTGMVRQWENTVRQFLEEQGDKALASQANFTNDAVESINDLGIRESLKHSRDYMKRVMAIPDNDEIRTAQAFNHIADKFYGKKFLEGAPRDWALKLTDADPTRALKAATFNLHLGWFNIRQVFVQAMNAQIAMSIAPQHAPLAMLDSFAMRAAVFSDDPAVWRKVARLNPTLDADDFVKNVQDFKKSGLIDGIIRQGDWDSHVSGIGNQSFKTLRKVAGAGQVFFKEGELASRIFSWNIARRRLGKDADVRALSDETTRLTMDMSSANSAVWQNNILAIPTQFMQVFAKFTENTVRGLVLGKEGGANWSRGEALSVLMGQFAMFGAVGVPIAEDAASYLAQLTGSTPQEFMENNPHIVEAIDEGALGVFTRIMGFDSNFSSSASLMQGLFSENAISKSLQALSEVVAQGYTDVDPSEFLGASVNTVVRAGNVVNTMIRNTKLFWSAPSFDNLGFAALENIDAIASLTSTWSNIEKARLLHKVGVVSKKGTTLLGADRFEGMSLQTQFARAMGMPTDLEDSYWRAKKSNFDFQREKRRINGMMREARARFMEHGNWERWKTEERAIMSLLENEAQEAEFRQFMIKEAFKDDDLSRQDQQSLKHFLMGNGEIVPSFRARLEEE